MRWLVATAALAACGRIAFDPFDDASLGDAGRGDGGIGSDGSVGPPTGDVCADAVTVTQGVATNLVIAGAVDDYPGSLCGNGPEIILRFDSPQAGNPSINTQSTFNGGVFAGTSCPPAPGSCVFFGPGAGTLMPQVSAGVNYLAIDRTGGTGGTLTLTIP